MSDELPLWISGDNYTLASKLSDPVSNSLKGSCHLSVCHLNPLAHSIHMSSPTSLTSAQVSTMAPRDRSRGRNVQIYNAKDHTSVLGGLILTNGVTNANFYFMIEIVVLFTTDFEIRDEGDTKIERNDDPLQPGAYYVNATGKFLCRLYRLSFLTN